MENNSPNLTYGWYWYVLQANNCVDRKYFSTTKIQPYSSFPPASCPFEQMDSKELKRKSAYPCSSLSSYTFSQTEFEKAACGVFGHFFRGHLTHTQKWIWIFFLLHLSCSAAQFAVRELSQLMVYIHKLFVI